MAQSTVSGKFFAFLICLGGFVVGFGKDTPAVPESLLRIERLGVADGLSQGFVNHILQDRQGFLWIGTGDGLNRYDGHGFQTYRHDPFDNTSLSGSFINELFEDSRGWLWVAAANEPLNVMSQTRDHCIRVDSSYGFRRGPGFKEVKRIFEDPQGRIWLVCTPLQVFVSGVDSVGRWRFQEIDLSSVLSGNRPYEGSLALDQYGTPFLLADRRLYMMNNHVLTAPAKEIPLGEEARDLFEEYGAHYLTLSPKGECFIGSKDALVRHQFDSGQSQILVTPQAHSYSDHPLVRYVLTPDGREWVLHDRHLIQVSFPPLSASLDTIHFHQKIPDVVFHAQDQSGLIWMGMDGTGLSRWNPGETGFQHYARGKFVYNIVEDGQENLWSAHGKLDPVTGNLEVPEKWSEWVKKLRPQFIPVRDSLGNLWNFNIPWRGRLKNPGVEARRFDPRTEEVFLPPIIELEDSVPGRPLPFVDPRGRIWLGTTVGMYLFDPESHSLQLFPLPVPIREDNENNELYHANPDRDGSMWVSTCEGVLSFDPEAAVSGKGQVYKWYRAGEARPGQLAYRLVTCVLPDPVDTTRYWVSTKGGGLYAFFPGRHHFEHIGQERGLPNPVVYGLLPDAEGKIWLSTNRGLARFDPEKRTFRNYDSSDGLQDDEFNTFSFCRARNGRLYFGGVNGISGFDPSGLKDNPHPPQTVLTHLRLGNERIPNDGSHPLLPQSIAALDEICLPYDQNMIGIEFAALEFTAPHRNRFWVQLEGMEPLEIPAGDQRLATFTNLEPGSYKFEVRSANNDGVWDEKGASIRITILPPWWKTVWAYTGYLCLLALAGYLFMRYRLRRIRLQEELKAQQSYARQLEALDQTKTDFFSNITHEFRTPLTLILGPLERLLAGEANPEKQRHLGMLQRNGKKLLQLINQLLEMARLERQVSHVHFQNGDLLAFLRAWMEPFQLEAQTKGIFFQLLADPVTLPMHLDPVQTEIVVQNLLSNAMKFTESGGKVWLEVEEIGEEVEIRVKDTGLGIPKDEQGKIFNRFYQVESPQRSRHGGTGIGLALASELAGLLGGSLTVESKSGEGSIFKLVLPRFAGQEVNEDCSPVAKDFALGEQGVFEENSLETEEQPLVLVVEDNADMRAYVRTCLGSDFRVVEAANGREGLELAVELMPDLIVSDLMMPEKDGLELTAALRGADRTSHIPVVMLTARTGKVARLEGWRAGVDAFLTKPFQADELKLRIGKMIEFRGKIQARVRAAGAEEVVEGLSLRDQRFMDRVGEALQEHLGEEGFNVAVLGKTVGMSKAHFFRKLKALTGQSPSQYLRSQRMRKARQLLQENTGLLSIAEVAYAVGYGNPSYFSTSFKQEFGHSPSAQPSASKTAP